MHNNAESTRNRPKIAKLLVKMGKKQFGDPFEPFSYTGVTEADRLLNDIKNYPHAFVFGCLMDRQITAERAWMIPYQISQRLGTFRFAKLAQLSQSEITRLMTIPVPLHRFTKIMSKNLHLAIGMIKKGYGGSAARIWMNRPSSAEVIYRFLQFPGIGQKIATMAANLLARNFKIPFSDYSALDVSPDVHIRRVFARLGLSASSDITSVTYAARALHPEFPGLLDSPIWRIGRNLCKPRNPLCQQCPMRRLCPTANGKPTDY